VVTLVNESKIAENCKKIVLTIKQKLKLLEKFEIGGRVSIRISQRLWDID
jgi:hypothetical protein